MSRAAQPLVRPMFEGPVDVIGDIHGELAPLDALLAHLGHVDGRHPAGRRLVFLGDLTDRGPDSPGVVARVKGLIDRGRAQCLLGNHELNILRAERKHGNAWISGQPEALDRSGRIVPQVYADAALRSDIAGFFRTLPLALERPDLRGVHACWHGGLVNEARQAEDVLDLYDRAAARIEAQLQERGVGDWTECELAHQNENPVKVLTSGGEQRAAIPFEAGGKVRVLERVRWWQAYDDGVFTVFGHYWRTPVPGLPKGESLFADALPYARLGRGRAMCIDYSVGGRWCERLQPDFAGRYETRLAALRWPEGRLMFDDGGEVELE
jgi:hypothetical protein